MSCVLPVDINTSKNSRHMLPCGVFNLSSLFVAHASARFQFFKHNFKGFRQITPTTLVALIYQKHKEPAYIRKAKGVTTKCVLTPRTDLYFFCRQIRFYLKLYRRIVLDRPVDAADSTHMCAPLYLSKRNNHFLLANLTDSCTCIPLNTKYGPARAQGSRILFSPQEMLGCLFPHLAQHYPGRAVVATKLSLVRTGGVVLPFSSRK